VSEDWGGKATGIVKRYEVRSSGRIGQGKSGIESLGLVHSAKEKPQVCMLLTLRLEAVDEELEM
jgi:hypothetical protein